MHDATLDVPRTRCWRAPGNCSVSRSAVRHRRTQDIARRMLAQTSKEYRVRLFLVIPAPPPRADGTEVKLVRRVEFKYPDRLGIERSSDPFYWELSSPPEPGSCDPCPSNPRFQRSHYDAGWTTRHSAVRDLNGPGTSTWGDGSKSCHSGITPRSRFLSASKLG